MATSNQMRSINQKRDYLDRDLSGTEKMIKKYNRLEIGKYIDNRDDYMRSYKCVKCEGLLYKAVQTVCGCRYCGNCGKSLIDSTESKFCQGNSDDCPNTELNLDNIIIDNATNREILKFVTLKCFHKDCTASEKLHDMEHHLITCEFREEDCPNEGCGQSIPFNKIEFHLKNECFKRLFKCPDCLKEFHYAHFINVHIELSEKSNFNDICPKLKRDCIFCNEKGVLIKKHVLESCIEQPLSCLFSLCTFIGSRQQLIHHLLANNHASNEVKALIKQVNNLNVQFEALKKENEDLKNENETLTIVSEESNKNIQHLSNEIKSLQQNTPRSTMTDESIVFRSGKFIWHVKDFSKTQQNIRNKLTNTNFITSSPFYTSEFGYKMCLKIYPLGDGNERNHLSVFFTLMKGEYDDILKWPFDKKLKLSLIDAHNLQNTKTDVFRPDINSICYKKPESNYNIASGSPKFVSFDELARFTKDDCFFLKIEIVQ